MLKRHFFIKVVVIAILSAIVIWQQPAFAWNKAGHMVSGAIAYSELKPNHPQVIEEIATILKEHPEYSKFEAQWNALNQSDISPEAKNLYLFMWAAKWPDEARDNNTFNRPTWHYINFPYQPDRSSNSIPREILDEENILFAFQKNLDVIQSNPSNSDKAVAICWLFHLIGDVHQPLHTTKLITNQYPEPEGDRGGTSFYIRVRPDNQTISLHKFWDDLILGSERFQTVRNTATRLRATYQRNQLPQLRETKFNNWAKSESFKIARQDVYLNGILSGSSDKNDGKVLPENYAATAKPIAERQMSLAGYRLADVFNQLFG
ncbi:S1/P1 nuclease [Anabaena azotica]|uniref:S1/P1 nuclease n=1 Tax=Anabaena azotica FACHB-119 TaxID=947527 RepID=A0ABR8DDG1_9NOST|nr:S1/P1 nuclease [Anabaena azotica]MBD2505149.1 S1/P1 nuclease [Anabaena azotica FACHB-119]